MEPGIGEWNQTKDVILEFLAGGLAAWVAWELRALRIAFERLMITVHGHEERIGKLEDKDFEK